MPRYDYRCSEGHIFERRAGYADDVTSCACGQAASRVAVNQIGFSGFATTPQGQHDFREGYRRFREASESIEDARQRAEERYQRPVAPAELFNPALKKARKLNAAGVTADQIKT